MNYYWIEITGKSSKHLLNQILKQNINIINIKYYKDKIHLKISYEEYKKIIKIKTTSKIKIIKTSGKKKIYEDIIKYKISIITFIMGIFLCIFLSQTTLFIKIDTENKQLKKIIKEELKENNITIFSIKKSYKEKEQIKEKIKNKNLEKIEWLEIENKGVITKIKIIERKITKETKNNDYKDIIANKNGYIRKIESERGEVLKNPGDYVKKGEIIISGNIYRNEKIIDKVKAEGKIYAEVWYIVKGEKNKEYTKLIEKEKGNKKLILKIFNKKITLLKIPKKVKQKKEIKLFENNIFKLSLLEEKKYYTKKDKYKKEELSKILETKARKKIEKSLKENEYIISQKTLKKSLENDKLYIEVLFKVYEDISQEKNIKKEEQKQEKEE